MSRCGCGTECTCEVVAGCGTKVTGSGQPEEDPFEIAVDPDSLAGDGLKPQGDACKLAVDLVPGGGIEHDANGALYTTDAVPDVDPSKPSVPALLSSRSEQRDIVGAYLGGYLYKPQSTRNAVHNAVDRGYDLLHLGVRPLADGTPAITPDEMMGRQNGNIQDFGNPTPVQDQSPARWARIRNRAGVDDPATGNDGKPTATDSLAGWFGYLEPNEDGLLTLGEVLRIVDGRIVLVLELMWPPMENGAWKQGHEVPNQRVTAFLRHIRTLFRRYGAQNQVIVTTRHPLVPGEGDQKRDVFDELSLPHAGPAAYIEQDLPQQNQGSQQRQTRNDDDQIQSSQWLFANKTIPAGKIKQAAQGRNVILAPLTRHVDLDNLMQPSGAIGVLSGDPEYTAGHLESHPLYAGYAYRRRVSAYHHSVITHGLIGPREDWWDSVHPFQRGAFPRYLPPENPDHRGEYILGRETKETSYPGYWVLHGEHCPIGSDEFTLSGWLNVYRNYQAAKRLVAAEILFARRTDSPVPGDGLAGASDKSGYVLSYRTVAGGGQHVTVACWDPAAGKHAVLKTWDVSGLENSWVAFRLHVRGNGIIVALVDRDTNQPLGDYPPYYSAQDSNGNHKRLGSADSGNRGGYLFFGRLIDDGTPGPKDDPESAAFARITAIPSTGEPKPPPPPDDGDGGGGDKPPPKPPPDEGNPPPKPPPPKPPPPPKTYVVQPGDTLSEIAAKHNTTVGAIQKLNGIENPDAIQEGQVLKIPN